MPAYENGKDTYRRIIDAAKRLYYLKGPSKTTNAQIANEACIQLSSLTYYFKNKRELLRDVTHEIIHNLSSFAADISIEKSELIPIIYLLLLYFVLYTDSNHYRQFAEATKKYYIINDKKNHIHYVQFIKSLCDLAGCPIQGINTPIGIENIHTITVNSSMVMLRSSHAGLINIDYKYIAKWNIDFVMWTLGIQNSDAVDAAFDEAVEIFEHADMSRYDLSFI